MERTKKIIKALFQSVEDLANHCEPDGIVSEEDLRYIQRQVFNAFVLAEAKTMNTNYDMPLEEAKNSTLFDLFYEVADII